MQRQSRYHDSVSRWTLPSVARMPFEGIPVITLSTPVKLALPSLFIASLPERAIGFSYPRGREGQVLGFSLMTLTVMLALALSHTLGLAGVAIVFWALGGTAVVMLYNCATNGMAFVKELCCTCRLRPLIEEHELMHLGGESSEREVWRAAKDKYTYESLGLGTDPRICSFCPIARHLKEH